MKRKFTTDGTKTTTEFVFEKGEITCVDTLLSISQDSTKFFKEVDDERRQCIVKKLKIIVEVLE
jgi:hypothetical protein